MNPALRRLLPTLALALLGAALAGCGGGHAPFVSQRLYAMGTWVDVTLEAPHAGAAPALADVEHMLRGFERDYYAWTDGELARVNRALAAGRGIDVSAGLAKLLILSRRVSARSGGAFDPAVGGLVELWGFQSPPSPAAAPPSTEAIRAWLAAGASIRELSIDGTQVSSSNPAVKLDLGGIAKGEAVDRAVALLARRGVRNALVNAGGNLRALGTRGDRPWRIGIKTPRGNGILGVVELADGEAASTSGDYERYFEQGGRRYHHLLDPRTGYPAEGTEAVTVIAGSGAEADAASTALFVAGAAHWRQVAAALGIALALRVDSTGTIEVTEGMARRLASAGDAPDVVVVSS